MFFAINLAMQIQLGSSIGLSIPTRRESCEFDELLNFEINYRL